MAKGTIDVRHNSLNLIRFLAAFQVMYMHAYVHMDVQTPFLLNAFVNFFKGVPIFFTLSGFLIWHSIGRSGTFTDYANKRFWRIYPELWVAVAIELIVLLVLYHEPFDWPQFGLFAIGQATFFQFWTPDFLRGYGVGCPNGALWTITVLIQFYICAFFIYKWLHNRNKYVWGIVITISIVIGVLTQPIIDYLPETIGKLYGITLLPYLWMFIIAGFVAEYQETILPFFKKVWLALILLLLANKYLAHIDLQVFTYPLLGTLLLFCGLLGFAYAIPQINIKTDISYAMYIYHMTVINAIIVLGYTKEPIYMMVALIFSIGLSILSTKTVGNWSSSIKRKLIK